MLTSFRINICEKRGRGPTSHSPRIVRSTPLETYNQRAFAVQIALGVTPTRAIIPRSVEIEEDT
jgi:hypothetical protein